MTYEFVSSVNKFQIIKSDTFTGLDRVNFKRDLYLTNEILSRFFFLFKENLRLIESKNQIQYRFISLPSILIFDQFYLLIEMTFKSTQNINWNALNLKQKKNEKRTNRSWKSSLWVILIEFFYFCFIFKKISLKYRRIRWNGVQNNLTIVLKDCWMRSEIESDFVSVRLSFTQKSIGGKSSITNGWSISFDVSICHLI